MGTPDFPTLTLGGTIMAQCPKCGSTATPDARFCDNCGATLAPEQRSHSQDSEQPRFCRGCGTPLPPGDRFCPNCGQDSKTDSVPKPSSTPVAGGGRERTWKAPAIALIIVAVGILAFFVIKHVHSSRNTPKETTVLLTFPQGGKFGYMDRDGRVVIQPLFDSARRFLDGLAVVQVGKKWGCIDKAGKIVIKPQFDRPYSFSEGLAAVSVGGKWGYIDNTGKTVINMQFDLALPFSDGLACTLVGDKWGLIDRNGKPIAKLDFENTRGFSEGLAAVSRHDKWGFVDKTGKVCITLRFDDAHQFSEGLAPVRVNNKWTFIDKTGTIATNLLFDQTNGFSEGLAGVLIGGKWGFVDKTGRLAIPPKFDGVGNFGDGLAGVTISGKVGYIDNTGKVVWQENGVSAPEPAAPHVAGDGKAACQSNVKQLSTAVLMYAQDYDGYYPPPDRWNNAVETYIRDNGLLVCPGETSGSSVPDYALNSRLKGLKGAEVKAPGATVMMFDSAQGPNEFGGPEKLPPVPRHSGGDTIGFTDGHVNWYLRRDALKLNWNPK